MIQEEEEFRRSDHECNFEHIHVGHLERNVERAGESLGNEVRDGKTDIGVICMVVTGRNMRTDEVLREGLGMGCHCMKRQLKETPEEQSKRKEKIQLIH